MVKVLLVDDEAGVLETMRIFLERDGKIQIESAISAENALNVMTATRPDVVVCDFLMPGMDGIDLLKTLRNTGNTVPFILMTGRGREDVAMRALNEGADFYIQKTGDVAPMTSELRNMVMQCFHRNQAEKAEKEARDRFELFTKSARDMIYRMRLKPAPAMEYMSPSVELFVGYTAEDFYKDPDLIFRCIHPDDAGALDEAMKHPETYDRPVAFRWLHKDGSVTWAEDVWVPMRDATGEIVAVDGISRDITAHVATEKALEMANKRLALLGRMIKHDAMNQLMLIQNTADMAKHECPNGLAERLDRIVAAAHVIQMQLEFSGYELDAAGDRPAWKSLPDIVSSAVSMANVDGLKVTTDLDDIELPGDIALGRVLSNLLEDTRAHGEKAKSARISTSMNGGEVDLIYEDDGVGIAQELKERIFERGFGKRTGYGLYLSREVLALSGITMSEEGVPGTGARFVIRMPRTAVRAAKK